MKSIVGTIGKDTYNFALLYCLSAHNYAMNSRSSLLENLT